MEAIFYKKNRSMPVVINLNNGTFRIQRICNGFEVWRSFSIADRIVEEPVFDIVSEDNLYVDYLSLKFPLQVVLISWKVQQVSIKNYLF